MGEFDFEDGDQEFDMIDEQIENEPSIPDEPEESTHEYIKRVEKENNIIRHEHRNIDDLPDSISLGTDGKLGCVKIYINANDKHDSEQKIIKALELRKFMRDKEKEIEGLQ